MADRLIWNIPPPGVARLTAALGGADDILAALLRQFSNDAAADILPFLHEHGVEYESCSRIGD